MALIRLTGRRLNQKWGTPSTAEEIYAHLYPKVLSVFTLLACVVQSRRDHVYNTDGP